MNIMNKKLIWTNYAFTLHLRPVVLLVVVVLLVALLVLVAETLLPRLQTAQQKPRRWWSSQTLSCWTKWWSS